jgi:D-alanyl-D-alanine carboxypeptidase/D-alanyl-D-alanine-endopeptidase (penicillin-binding protein 4)
MLQAAFAAALALDFEARLEQAIAHPALESAVLGICVMEMDGTVLFERNGGRPMVPASCMKLATIALACERLGADARPTTRFWKQDDGIYVDSPGDPGLTSDQLREAAKALGARPGPVWAKEAYRPGAGPGWESDDLPYDYAARASAFSVDRSAFVLRTEAGRIVVPVEGRLTVRRPSTRGAAKVQYDPARAALTVTGSLPPDGDVEELSQPDPAMFAARALGGTRLLRADSVPDRTPDYEIVGQPYLSHAKACGEESVNILAEHLLFLGSGQPDYPSAAATANALWEGVVGPGEVVQVDGSGLSRRNRATARGMCRILAWAHSRPWWAQFYDALAAPGEGTLEKRLAGSSFAGKTGTMRGIVCLSGVCTGPNGTPVAVTIMANGTTRPPAHVRAVQDRVVRAVEPPGGQS